MKIANLDTIQVSTRIRSLEARRMIVERRGDRYDPELTRIRRQLSPLLRRRNELKPKATLVLTPELEQGNAGPLRSLLDLEPDYETTFGEPS